LIAMLAAAGILWTSFRPREAAPPNGESLSTEERTALDTLMNDDIEKR
jgi:hypothetical protein